MKPARLIFLALLTACLTAPVGAGAEGSAAVPPAPEASVQKPAAADPVVRMGQVDVERIGADSLFAKNGQNEFVELKKKLQGQIDSRRKQLEKQQAALESKLKTLSPAQREAKAKEFQKKVDEFQKSGLEAEKELKAKQEELSERMFRAVEQVSKEVGKTKGLALVLFRRDVLYRADSVETLDVTDEVIKRIDAATGK